MTNPTPWLVLVPLVWATLAFVRGPAGGGRMAIAAAILQLLLVIELSRQVMVDGSRIYAVGGWHGPLGIELLADGLSCVMLLLVQVTIVPLAFYARAYFALSPDGGRYFWPLTGFLLAAMNALLLAADVFNMYVTLELLGLAAAGLVAAAGGAGPVSAALRYLLAALVGSSAYLFGVALLYGAYGSVSLRILTPLVTPDAPPAISVAAALMLVGLLIKTALFPFHFWLPPAHGGAPAPVSALLSALVIKASFYLIVRLWLTLFEPLADAAAAQVIGMLGASAILWGSIMALRQVRLKMLVAYSTVAQIGYLFLLFPLATQTAEVAENSALQGAVMQAVAHGLAKAAMFASVGAMVLSMERDDINHLGGLSSRMPLTLFTFGLAGVTLMGLPPSSGFVAKWLLIDGAQVGGQWGWVVVMIIGGVLTAAYVFKVLRRAFLIVEPDTTFRPLPRMLVWPAFILALIALGLGLRATEVLQLLVRP